MSPQLAAPPALNRAFAILAAEWRAATRLAAGPAAAADHPAYRAVVRLGPGVVPLLLAALADAPDPWFAALRELTGADPVPPPDRGRPAPVGPMARLGPCPRADTIAGADGLSFRRPRRAIRGIG